MRRSFTTVERAELTRALLTIVLVALAGAWVNAFMALGSEGVSASTLGGVILTPVFGVLFAFGLVQAHRLVLEVRELATT